MTLQIEYFDTPCTEYFNLNYRIEILNDDYIIRGCSFMLPSGEEITAHADMQFSDPGVPFFGDLYIDANKRLSLVVMSYDLCKFITKNPGNEISFGAHRLTRLFSTVGRKDGVLILKASRIILSGKNSDGGPDSGIVQAMQENNNPDMQKARSRLAASALRPWDDMNSEEKDVIMQKIAVTMGFVAPPAT